MTQIYTFKYILLQPIEDKFHLELLRVVKMKVCSNDLGHMTKIAAMPIYGKTP